MQSSKNLVLFGFFVLSIFLAYLIVKPYLVSMIVFAIFAYLFCPVHDRINKYLKRPALSAFVLSLAILFVVLVPLVFLVNAISGEIGQAISSVSELLNGASNECESSNNLVCKLRTLMLEYFAGMRVQSLTDVLTGDLTSFLINVGSGFFYGISNVIINIFIGIFVMFYFFYEGEKFTKFLVQLIPAKKKRFQELKRRFDIMVRGVFVGQLLIAIIQGAVATIGFFIVGFESLFLMGTLAVISSILPIVGSSVVWVPASLYLIIEGLMTGANIILVKGLFLFLYGALVVSTIDNILRPFLMSRKKAIHPIVVLVGVLGGINLFGILGFIVGPIILNFSIIFIKIYMEEIE